MFRCAHEPGHSSIEFPDHSLQFESWYPTAKCRVCGERFELRRDQIFLDGIDGRGGLTEWYLLELIAYTDC
jgi:hypothetical protein